MKEKEVIKISVRNLVEFILREGDIDNRISGAADKDAMMLGSKLHRKIQRQMDSDYIAEVSLKYMISFEEFDLQIEGRADGIAGGVMIDEIKCVLKELHHITEPIGIHLAQAKCYAYIYGKQQALALIKVQMTYCNMETEEVKRFQETYTLKELEVWFLNIANLYKKWAKFQVEWRITRNSSIKGVEFPFSYREGQKELVTSVYKTILRKKKLFIQAPTGVGKTMATVFPAIKALGEGLGDKIFYLTAKTITRTVAEQAFVTLKEQALQCKVITLTAKEKICFCEEVDCNPDACKYARGHFDRVNDAVYDMLSTTSDMSRSSLEEQAKKYQVCPFELSLDVSTWVDAVICDYNYLFDPNAHLRRFFSEGGKEEFIFLIDEAHNLVERGREMFSATIYKEEFLALKQMVKHMDKKLEKQLESCNRQLLELKRECENYQILENIGHFSLKLMNLTIEMERFLEECQNQETKKEVLNLYFHVRTFLNIFDRLDENYVIYTEMEANGMFKLKLFCINPSKNIQECLDVGNSTIFFSATLLPIMYYKQLLSTDAEDYAVYADSPFDINNRLLIMGTDVSTKYTRRTNEMYQRYANYMTDALRVKKGNYLAFFPSYQLMEEVYAKFEIQIAPHTTCMMQKRNMNEADREIFLQEFALKREESLIGFCVMGGIFSEGIDLVEEQLIGAFIIGNGLPQVCPEREILKRYFDSKGLNGFDYAYTYPGVNKVLQAAGRVIRTENDEGMIILLDDRFQGRQYRDIFPREWEKYEICNVENVAGKMKEFWSGKVKNNTDL